MFDTKERVSSEVEQDARRLADSLSRLLGVSVQEGKEKLQQGSQTARQTMQKFSDMMRENCKTVDLYARDHVWTTVAVSVAVGFLMGMISRRGRHS